MCKTSVGAEPLNRNFQQREWHFQTLFLTYRPQVLPKPQLRTLTTFVRDVLTRLSPVAPSPTPHMLKNPIKIKTEKWGKEAGKKERKKRWKQTQPTPINSHIPLLPISNPNSINPFHGRFYLGRFLKILSSLLFLIFPSLLSSPPSLSVQQRKGSKKERDTKRRSRNKHTRIYFF